MLGGGGGNGSVNFGYVRHKHFFLGKKYNFMQFENYIKLMKLVYFEIVDLHY